MDQITSQSTNQMCFKHSQKRIKFVQVNDLSNSQNNPLFYCTHCVNKDLAFKGINYLLISQIIEEGDINVIQKWPPVNDYTVLDKLIDFTEHSDSSTSVVHQINQYFTVLKDEFIRKVDLCQKKMINQALLLPFSKDSILKQYQEISQISQLKSVLVKEGEKRQADQQQRCREFIKEMEAKKEKNSQLLQNLLDQCQQKEKLISFEYPNQIKDSIFSFIDEIDFFQSKIQASFSNNQNNNQENTNSSKIMKLISNKSNFCSQDFLFQIQAVLDKINPLLQSISFENMFEQNKSPIDFSKLDENKLNLMKDFVEHLTKIETNREYQSKIQNTQECILLKQIIDSNTNFVNNHLKEQLPKLFNDIYPLLKQVNFTNGTLQNEKFDCFRKLSDSSIEDLYQLIKKSQLLNGENKYSQSQTKILRDQIKNFLIQFENVDEIFRKYPIFDLLQKKQNKEKNLQIQFMKTAYQDGYNRTEINQTNQVCIREQYQGKYCDDDSANFISDLVLEKEQKYIFRFKIEFQRKDSFEVLIGLSKKNVCDKTSGYSDYMSCYLRKTDNNQIQYAGDFGVSDHLKGDKLRLSNENEVEMRVWLGGKQLEILDYPHYKYKVAINDQYKNNLLANDLALYLGITYKQVQVTLTSAVQVSDFPN